MSRSARAGCVWCPRERHGSLRDTQDVLPSDRPDPLASRDAEGTRAEHDERSAVRLCDESGTWRRKSEETTDIDVGGCIAKGIEARVARRQPAHVRDVRRSTFGVPGNARPSAQVNTGYGVDRSFAEYVVADGNVGVTKVSGARDAHHAGLARCTVPGMTGIERIGGWSMAL